MNSVLLSAIFPDHMEEARLGVGKKAKVQTGIYLRVGK